jgi:hypothetical protein
MALFDDHAESNRSRAVELVEQTIAGLGLDVPSTRLASDGGTDRYALKRGSASLVISVHRGEEGDPDGTLRVVSPCVRLSGDRDWASLYVWLLSANARELRGAAFGLLDGEVVVVAERSLTDLDASEVRATVRMVGAAADRYDDILAEQFGAVRSCDVA